MTSLKAHGKQRETKNAKRDGMFKAVRSVVYVSECVKNVVCECWRLNDKRIKQSTWSDWELWAQVLPVIQSETPSLSNTYSQKKQGTSKQAQGPLEPPVWGSCHFTPGCKLHLYTEVTCQCGQDLPQKAEIGF